MSSLVTKFFARKALAHAIAGAAVITAASFPATVYAQETSAMVRGSVTDMSGAAVAGADVVITSQRTVVVDFTKWITTDCFNLNDPGTHISKERGAQWRGDNGRDFYDGDAIERRIRTILSGADFPAGALFAT